MSASTFVLILCAALLNASWNALVKSGVDKQLEVALVATGAAVIGVLVLPWLSQPAQESWRYIAASTPVQVAYYFVLAAAYRRGDMSETYPLMRGLAPFMVGIAAGPLVGELLSLHRWFGIALICSGALCMAVDAHLRGGSRHWTLPLAAVNAAIIALYTVIDGLGARRSGAPFAYTLWVFVLTAIPLLVFIGLRRGKELFHYLRGRMKFGLLGGAATIGSYGLTLTAITVAPVALVAALRETSILFATLLAVLILKERIGWLRYVAISFIAVGAMTIRLS